MVAGAADTIRRPRAADTFVVSSETKRAFRVIVGRRKLTRAPPRGFRYRAAEDFYFFFYFTDDDVASYVSVSFVHRNGYRAVITRTAERFGGGPREHRTNVTLPR